MSLIVQVFEWALEGFNGSGGFQEKQIWEWKYAEPCFSKQQSLESARDDCTPAVALCQKQRQRRRK